MLFFTVIQCVIKKKKNLVDIIILYPKMHDIVQYTQIYVNA